MFTIGLGFEDTLASFSVTRISDESLPQGSGNFPLPTLCDFNHIYRGFSLGLRVT